MGTGTGVNMSIKLAAIDLDDTLLDSRHRISPACIKAIQRVNKQGVHVILATGRMYRATIPYAQQLGLDLPLITYQGALVKHGYSGDVLYERTIGMDLALKITDLLESRRIDYHIYANDQLYTRKLVPVLEKHTRVTGIEPMLVKDIADIFKESLPLEIMAVFERKSQRQDIEQKIINLYGEHLHMTKFKYDSLEIMDRCATKARALEAVAAHLNIHQHEVMAIGDSYNDLPMIRWAGIGVAVGNAHPLVKEAADFITGSNEEDGVILALEKYIG